MPVEQWLSDLAGHQYFLWWEIKSLSSGLSVEFRFCRLGIGLAMCIFNMHLDCLFPGISSEKSEKYCIWNISLILFSDLSTMTSLPSYPLPSVQHTHTHTHTHTLRNPHAQITYLVPKLLRYSLCSSETLVFSKKDKPSIRQSIFSQEVLVSQGRQTGRQLTVMQSDKAPSTGCVAECSVALMCRLLLCAQWGGWLSPLGRVSLSQACCMSFSCTVSSVSWTALHLCGA